jgi:hypothetical protein
MDIFLWPHAISSHVTLPANDGAASEAEAEEEEEKSNGC